MVAGQLSLGLSTCCSSSMSKPLINERRTLRVTEKRYNTGDSSICAPIAWHRKAIVTFLEPDAGLQPRSVVVTQDVPAAPSLTVELYARQQQDELLARLPGFAIEKRGSLATRGAEVPYIVYSWRPAQGPIITQFQVYFYRSPQAWTITGTALSSEAQAFEAQFFALAASFDIGPGPG